jgi:hypothetical protein
MFEGYIVRFIIKGKVGRLTFDTNEEARAAARAFSIVGVPWLITIDGNIVGGYSTIGEQNLMLSA